MFIEKWRDTAFGSDYGGDFREFLEEIPADRLTFKILFEHCDLNEYFIHHRLLKRRLDNKVVINSKAFNQYVYYEDAVIALAAIVVESELNGSADLVNAYGSKTLIVDVARSELVTLKTAITYMYENHDRFLFFKKKLDKKMLADVADIIVQLQRCIDIKYKHFFFKN